MNMKMLLWIPLAAGLFLPPAAAADDDLAVVVNKGNTVDNLTKAQLRKILLGEQPSWPGGKKVSVVLRAPGQAEREGVLRSICGMSEDDFAAHLMHASFNGDAASPPKAMATGEAVRSLVGILPGGIGFLRTADVNESVRAVMVDGLAAGQDGYKIKSGK
jgi:ABC-type phosphate transport system substrate-binding protein